MKMHPKNVWTAEKSEFWLEKIIMTVRCGYHDDKDSNRERLPLFCLLENKVHEKSKLKWEKNANL